jgi:hypothetical protein
MELRPIWTELLKNFKIVYSVRKSINLFKTAIT